MGRGKGSGTGYPLTFNCFRCRRSVNGCIGGFVSYCRHAQVRTGRVRPLSRPQQSKGHPRVLRERHEYRCTCGHTGWTRHADVLRVPLMEDK